MPTRMTWRPGREGATLYAYPETRQAHQGDACAHDEPDGYRVEPATAADEPAARAAPNDALHRRSRSLADVGEKA